MFWNKCIDSPATGVHHQQLIHRLPSLRQLSGEGKVVCVTGALGNIASWLVKLFLDCGYIMIQKRQHLLALDGAKKILSLFEANLTAKTSINSAVNGCICVFHTASFGSAVYSFF
ncbi:putative cinnamyl-alcohol dehydrogenase [Helianthus debilis subsp. tardiflorus]